jgi:hypothetical protein
MEALGFQQREMRVVHGQEDTPGLGLGAGLKERASKEAGEIQGRPVWNFTEGERSQGVQEAPLARRGRKLFIQPEASESK